MAAEALSAREALAIVAAQRQQVSRSLEVNVALVHGASGAAWLVGFGGYAADAGLQYQGLPVHLAPLLWPGTAAGVCGVLYLAGGLFFRDKIHYALGAWILAATAGSMFAGVPGNFAVLALAGGAGFLVATWRHVRIGKQAGE